MPRTAAHFGSDMSVWDELDSLERDADVALAETLSEAALEELRLRFLGRKGRLTAAAAALRDVPADQRPAFGKRLNEVRDSLEGAIGRRREALEAERDALAARTIDAPDALIAGERVLSVVRADRELKSDRFDPWHPPHLEVVEVTELDPNVAPTNSDFVWD